MRLPTSASVVLRWPRAGVPRPRPSPRPSLPFPCRLSLCPIRTGPALAAATYSTVMSSSSPRLSISYGPSTPPLLTMTIPEHFASVVARFSDRPAVIARSPVPRGLGDVGAAPETSSSSPPHAARETVYTYGDLDRVSDLLADGLVRVTGVRRGDRVAVSLGNGPEFAALTYAVFKLGAILVPLNPAFTAAQVAAALTHLSVATVILTAVTDLPYKPGQGRSNRGLLAALLKDDSAPCLRHVVVVDNTADHAAVAAAGDFVFSSDGAVILREEDDAIRVADKSPRLTSFSALTGGQDIWQSDGLAQLAVSPPPRPQAAVPALAASDTINIQFTSGTTAQPKAAMLPHAAILNNGALIAHRLGLQPDDRVVCPPPLFHCFGSVLGYMATATTGAALLLPSPAFDPAAALRMAAAHRATALYGVATMFVAMLEVADGVLDAADRLTLQKHLRTGIAAGSSVPEELMRRLRSALGLRGDLAICYGMTETSPVSCMTDPWHDTPHQRAATVGRALPHTGVKIVDPADRGQVVPRNTPGELAVSGYGVMEGYWGDAARTAADRIDGEGPEEGVVVPWMHSGDEATMDDDGYVAVTGRIKDLVIRGGENIHPLEIENCLFAHGRVAEASVVGVADARYGEVVAAFVVPHGGVRVRGGMAVEEGGVEVDEASETDADGRDTLSADDVRAWVRDRLSPHLVPTYIFWTTGYPKTASGKIQKFKLRATAEALLKARGTG